MIGMGYGAPLIKSGTRIHCPMRGCLRHIYTVSSNIYYNQVISASLFEPVDKSTRLLKGQPAICPWCLAKYPEIKFDMKAIHGLVKQGLLVPWISLDGSCVFTEHGWTPYNPRRSGIPEKDPIRLKKRTFV